MGKKVKQDFSVLFDEDLTTGAVPNFYHCKAIRLNLLSTTQLSQV